MDTEYDNVDSAPLALDFFFFFAQDKSAPHWRTTSVLSCLKHV